MTKILFILFIPFYFLYANFLELSLENKNNYTFENQIFYDTNTTSTSNQHLSKKKNFNNLNIQGNFNDMIGINLNYSDIDGKEEFHSNEIYIGTPSLKYLAYKEETQNIIYDTYINPQTKMSQEGYEYTFVHFLVVSRSKIKTVNKEKFIRTIDKTPFEYDQDFYRNITLETKSLTSENFYFNTKDDVLNNEEYIYPIAIAKNINSWLRVYGVAIFSVEQYDYSEGDTYYLDENSTTVPKKEIREDGSDEYKSLVKDARFKGFGTGYKLTLEAHISDFSFFITSYKKDISLKNQSTAQDDGTYKDNIVALEKLKFKKQYTTFGLKYRF